MIIFIPLARENSGNMVPWPVHCLVTTQSELSQDKKMQIIIHPIMIGIQAV
jgi:hypothetical protein